MQSGLTNIDVDKTPYFSLQDEKKHTIDIKDPLTVRIERIVKETFSKRGCLISDELIKAISKKVLREVKSQLSEIKSENCQKTWSVLCCLAGWGLVGSMSYLCYYANPPDNDSPLSFSGQVAATIVPLGTIMISLVCLAGIAIKGACPDADCLVFTAYPESYLDHIISPIALEHARKVSDNPVYIGTFTTLSEVSRRDTRSSDEKGLGNINDLGLVSIISGYVP